MYKNGKEKIMAKNLKPLNKEYTRENSCFISYLIRNDRSINLNKWEENAIKIVDEITKLSYRFSAGSGCQ